MGKVRKRLNKFREKTKESQKKKKQKRQQGDDYKPFEDGPTVGEAKNLLIKVKKQKGYKIKVRYYYTKEYFLVDYGISKYKFNTGSFMGNGPYGLEKIKYEWSTILWLWRNNNEQ